MEMIPVASRVIAAVGYDSSTQALGIQFRSWRTYIYSGVPSAVFNELMLAESKGRYYNRRIRGKYIATRVS